MAGYVGNTDVCSTTMHTHRAGEAQRSLGKSDEPRHEKDRLQEGVGGEHRFERMTQKTNETIGKEQTPWKRDLGRGEGRGT